MNSIACTLIIVVLCETFDQIGAQCSGTPLSLTSRVTPADFLSPGLFTGYDTNLNCTWLIDSGTAGLPILLYSNSFYINCSVGDFVNIYDGSTVGDSPLITNLCLNTIWTSNYVSSDRYMLVQFVTDSSVYDSGFKMTYLSATDTSGTGCSSPTNLTASNTQSYLTSANFPNLYDSSSACRWLITAPGDLSVIQVQLEFSEIEFDSTCIYDKITLYDGSYICENKVLFEYCSMRTNVDTAHVTQPSYTSSSNTVLVIFTSDSTDNFHGFVLRYNATIAYSTTITTTTNEVTTIPNTSQQCQPCSSCISAEQQHSKSENNIYYMVISGLSGAASVIIAQIIYSLIKYLKGRKKPKNGLIRVQSIAPVPARTQHAMSRPATNALSFV